MDTINQRSAEGGANASSGANADSEGEEQDEPSSSQIDHLDVEDELASFRAKWQQEIRSQPVVKELNSIHTEQSKTDSYEESDEEIARAFFLKGTKLEKAGKLYESIKYYRKAVQLVPDIEFKFEYNRPKHSVAEIVPEEDFEETHETDDSDMSDEDEVIGDGQLYPRIQRKISKVGYLCTAKFQQSATHISVLPPEILLYILKWLVSRDLDLRSLEVFGSVCRGFYLCSRDPEIWRLACLRVWGLNCNSSPDSYGSWRNMFIKRSRLNFNGCYISKTTYIRHGENSFQDQFYRPWHLVTYYRYLRFFPDGIVLLLTSPDDPAQCVSQLKSRNPRPPAMCGYYRLKDDKVTVVVQKQNVSKIVQTSYKRSTKRREVDLSEQTFQMELKIQNHKNRHHAKLVWTYYRVLTRSKHGHETTCNFDLITNRFPPLWFSRVKSFTSESDQPLD